jgi:hypothetical protein
MRFAAEMPIFLNFHWPEIQMGGRILKFFFDFIDWFPLSPRLVTSAVMTPLGTTKTRPDRASLDDI